jgi:hypothetical protein
MLHGYVPNYLHCDSLVSALYNSLITNPGYPMNNKPIPSESFHKPILRLQPESTPFKLSILELKHSRCLSFFLLGPGLPSHHLTM